MKDNRHVIFSWIFWPAFVVGVVFQFIIWIGSSTEWPSLFDLVEGLGWGLAIPLVFSILAAMILTRQPDNRVGWLMRIAALGTVNPIPSILVYSLAPPESITWGLWLLLWFDNWSWIPVIFPIFLIPLYFPTGRPPSPRWDWVPRLAIGMWLFFMIYWSFSPEIGPINDDWKLPNPVGFNLLVMDELFSIVWGTGLLTVSSASVISLFIRYRHAKTNERQQIKWLLYAGAMFVVIYALILSFASEIGMSGWSNLMFVLSIMGIPIAITIAILRYRLYDIDVIIHKTLVYAMLTALLTLVYFGSVALLQSLIGRAVDENSPLIIVLSTLLIAALFSPLRRRTQTIIDRRFFRKKYDAQQVLAQFAQTARDEVSLETLTAKMLEVVQETMQPETLSIWFSRPKNE